MKIFSKSRDKKHKIIEILGIKFKFKCKYSNIYIEDGNIVQINDSLKLNEKFHLSVKGKNNKVIINSCGILENLTIDIYAENSCLEIGNSDFRQLHIVMGANNCNAGLIKNAKISIGNRTTVEEAFIGAWCGNTELTIGNDCMFSNKITIFNADCHPIYKKGTKEIVNRSYDLHIGNHCWIGQNVTILKNSILPDNTIIGSGSIVSGKFSENNCIIAGNPAKIIKKDIDWHMCGKGDYINNEVL